MTAIHEIATRIAYRAWREAGRGGPVSDGEFEATYSRLEAKWMGQVVQALDDSGMLVDSVRVEQVLKTQEEKIAFRKDWDRRVEEGR